MPMFLLTQKPPVIFFRTSSLRKCRRFWHFRHPVATWHYVIPVLSSSPSLAFIGRNLITTMESSDSPQRIKDSSAFALSSLISCAEHYGASPVTCLDPCERSHPQSRRWSDQVLDIPLFCRVIHHHPPKQVRFRYVPFTSYRFLQTPPLPVTPLRFGLSSP